MRITAWILIVFAVWWLGVWWNDPVEGRLMRPFAVAVGIAGCLLYVRGVRNEAFRTGQKFRLRQLLRFNLLECSLL